VCACCVLFCVPCGRRCVYLTCDGKTCILNPPHFILPLHFPTSHYQHTLHPHHTHYTPTTHHHPQIADIATYKKNLIFVGETFVYGMLGDTAAWDTLDEVGSACVHVCVCVCVCIYHFSPRHVTSPHTLQITTHFKIHTTKYHHLIKNRAMPSPPNSS
jgi:hypothetical protein